MIDLRERPWRKLRVVVEVTVPPTSKATEGDLIYLLQQQMTHTVALPRPAHPKAYIAVLRYKAFRSFLPAFLRSEKALKARKAQL